jgi:hypothetical protein
MKIPSLKMKVGRDSGFVKVNNDPSQDQPIVLQTTNRGGFNGNHDPFFISLGVNELILHNCMLDTGASTNVMPLGVMQQLGLETTRPYRNFYAMDAREVKVYGVIKNLLVYLTTEPETLDILMDICVVKIVLMI